MTLLNKNIKDARIAAGLTQTELAKKNRRKTTDHSEI